VNKLSPREMFCVTPRPRLRNRGPLSRHSHGDVVIRKNLEFTNTRWTMTRTRILSDTMKPSYQEHILHRCVHLVTSRPLHEKCNINGNPFFWSAKVLIFLNKKLNKKILPQNTNLQIKIFFGKHEIK